MSKYVSALTLGAGMVAATSASAQVSSLNFSHTVGNTDNGAVVSNVFSIDFSGEYTGSQFLVNLTSGSINQEAFQNFGTDVFPLTSPASGAVDAFPNLNFDTFMAQGGLTSEETQGTLQVGAGAVDLGGAPAAINDNDINTAMVFSQATNPAGGSGPVDENGFVIANLSFSADANGTVAFLISAGGEIFIERGFRVRDGFIAPEPTTAGLMGLACVGLVARRRESTA